MDTCRWTVNQGIEVFNRTGKFSSNLYKSEIVSKDSYGDPLIPKYLFETRPTWIHETPSDFRTNILRKLESNIKSAFTNLSKRNIKYFKFRFRSKKHNNVNELECDEASCSIAYRGNKVFLTVSGLGELELVVPKCDRRKNQMPTKVGGVCIRYHNNAWYVDLRYDVIPNTVSDQKRLCALDPGQRSFLSGVDLQGNLFQLGEGVQRRLTQLKLKRNLAQSLLMQLSKQSHRSYKSYKAFVRAKRSFYLATNKISNYVKELHYHCCKYLTDNYDKIIIPVYQTQRMVQRGKKKFNDMILSLNHYRFRELLIAKCQVLRKRVIVCTEEYTSVTCGRCNRYKMNLENQKIFNCSGCDYTADRDENAAFNILRFMVKKALSTKAIE